MASRDDAAAASLRSPFERRSDLGQSVIAPARPPPYGGGDEKGEVRRRPGFSARRALPKSLRGFPSADSSASGVWSEDCGTPLDRQETSDGASMVWDLAMERMSVIAGLVEGGAEDSPDALGAEVQSTEAHRVDAHGAEAHGAEAHRVVAQDADESAAEELSVAVWVTAAPDAPDAPTPLPSSLDRSSFSIASSVDVQSLDDVPYPVKFSPPQSAEPSRLLKRAGLNVEQEQPTGLEKKGFFYFASDEARFTVGNRKSRRRRRPFRRTDPDDIPVIPFDDISDVDKPTHRFLRLILPRSPKVPTSPSLSPLPIDDDEDDDDIKGGEDDDVYSLTKEGSRVTEEADSSQSSNVSDTCPPFCSPDVETGETATSRVSGTTITSGSSVATSAGGCLVGTLSRGFIADPIRDSLFARDFNACGSLISLPVIELDRARTIVPGSVPVPVPAFASTPAFASAPASVPAPVPTSTSHQAVPVSSGPVLWPRNFLEPRRHSLCGGPVPAPQTRRRRTYIHRDTGRLLSARFLTDKGPITVHSEPAWDAVVADQGKVALLQQERKEDRKDNCADDCVKSVGTPARGRRRRRVLSFMGHGR